MRRVCVGLGFVLVAAFGVGVFQTRSVGQPAAAAPDTNHKKITVSGSATVPVKPDTARVSVAVRATGNDFKTAVAECDKMGAEVEKALNALKLGGIEVKKGPINLLNTGVGFGGGGFRGGPPGPPPGPKGGMGGVGPGVGFGGAPVEVTRTFTVVATFGPNGAGALADIVPVSDKILTAAVSAGATEPPSFNNQNYGGQFGGFGGGGPSSGNSRIEFHRANWTQLRQDALKLAVADAVANAKVAAGIANLTAKDIVSISDQPNNSPWGGGVSGVPTNTGRGEILGEQELAVQVTVTFSY